MSILKKISTEARAMRSRLELHRALSKRTSASVELKQINPWKIFFWGGGRGVGNLDKKNYREGIF